MHPFFNPFQAYQPPQSGPHPGYSYHTHDIPLAPADASVHQRQSELGFANTCKSSLPPHHLSIPTSPGKTKFSFPARPPVLMSTGSPPPLPPRTTRQPQMQQSQVQTQQFRTPTLPLSNANQRGKQNAPWNNWGGSTGITSLPTGNGASVGGVPQSVSYLSTASSGKVQKYSASSA